MYALELVKEEDISCSQNLSQDLGLYTRERSVLLSPSLEHENSHFHVLLPTCASCATCFLGVLADQTSTVSHAVTAFPFPKLLVKESVLDQRDQAIRILLIIYHE